MSLWDDFVQKVQSAAGSVGSTFLKAAGARPGATIPLAQMMVEQQAIKAGMTPETAQALTDQSFNKIGLEDTEQVGTQVVTTLDKYVYDPAFQALSAATLAANPDTYKDVDGFVQGLSKAWTARQDISFGQAAADLTAYYADKRLPDWGPLAELNKVNVDIYDKEIREKIYLRTYDENGNRVDSQGNIIPSGSWIENAFMALSAGFDTAKQIKLDPLYRAGRGVKAIQTKALNVKTNKLVVEDVEAFNKSQLKAAQQTNQIWEEKLSLTKNQTELKRVQEFQAQIKAGTVNQSTIIKEVDNMRAAEGLDPLPVDTKLDVYIKQYDSYAKSLEKLIAKSESKIETLSVTKSITPTVASGVKEFITQAVTRKMTWEELSQHTVLRNYATDTEFLAKAIEQAALRGENAAYDVMLLSQGDPTAAIRLAGQHADLVKIIDDAQLRKSDLDLKIQEALYQQDPSVASALNAQKEKLSELINAMRADDNYLNMLIGPNNNVIGTMPTMPFSGSVSVLGKTKDISPIVEKFRADRAVVKAGLANGTIKLRDIILPGQEYSWTRVQKSALHRPVYVAQWVGHKLGREKPSGWVTLEGLDAYDGVIELRTMLEDSPVLTKFPEIKKKLADDFISAKNSLEKNKVLDNVDKTIVEKTAEYFGVQDIKVVDDITGAEESLSDVIYKQYVKLKAQQIEQYQKDKVFAIDSNQTMISNPVVESQLAYSRPMIDAKELFKHFKYNLGDYDQASIFAKSVKKVTGTVKGAKDDWIMPAWVTIDKFWRADVLLRLGYPQRNIISELTVLSMYDGGIARIYTGALGQGIKNFMTNRHAKFVDMREGIKSELAFAESKGTLKLAAIRNIFRRVDWNKYEQFAADTIKELQEEKQGYLDFIKEVTEHPDAYDISFKETYEIIDGFDELIALEEAKLAAIAERVAARGERFGAQNIVGKQTVKIGAYEFAGVYGGLQGKAAQILTSSGGRMAFDMTPFKLTLKDLGVELSDTWKAIYPDDKRYFLTLAEIANKQLRGSNTVNMIIKGESKESVIAYLESPRGKAELEVLNWVEDQPISGATKRKAGWPLEEEIVQGADGEGIIRSTIIKSTGVTPADNYYDFILNEVVNNYFPTEKMRNLIADKFKANKEITSAELRLVSKDAQLNPIHGQAVTQKGALQNPFQKAKSKLAHIVMDVVIKNGYKYLGEVPEDAIISHPFANAAYQTKLGEIVNLWEANKIMPTPNDILRAEYMARKWAIQQSRQFLYRVVRRNGIAGSIPVLSPFFQAQLSTFKRAGQLAYRNPDKAARLLWLYNQTQTHATEDENGNRWLQFTIPKEWYDENGFSSQFPESLKGALAANDVRKWDPHQFNLLIQGFRLMPAETLPGEAETTEDKVGRWAKAAQGMIGTGWTVQILANELLKNNPYVDQEIYNSTGLPIPARNILEMFASPYPTEKMLDPLMSGWNKRVASLIMRDGPDSQLMKNIFGENNADFERIQLVQLQYHLDQQRLGLEEPLSTDPGKNVDMILDMAAKEAAWVIGLRLISNLTDAFVPTIESSTISPLVAEYRRYQTKYGVEAFDKWLEDYPDLAYIATSRTQNLTGSSQSTEAAYLRNEHSKMIEDAIEANGMPREDALAFVQMVTNKNVGEPVLRDPYAGFWLKREGDRATISTEEGYENLREREGWAWFMNLQEDTNLALNRARITPYSAAAKDLVSKRKQEILKYGETNPEWYAKYTVLSGANSITGFMRSVNVAMNDTKFRNSLPKDSFWFDLEEIIKVREDLVGTNIRKGLGVPNTAQKERYWNEIKPYLSNPSTMYYYNKFFADDDFSKLAITGEE